MTKKTVKRKLSAAPAKKSLRPSRSKINSTHPTKQAHRMKDGELDVRRINAQNRIRATVTGTRNIDEAVHKLNGWLLELMKAMNWDSRERALSAYRATLHTVRDLLPDNNVVHFGAQLPLILKGIFYDGWTLKTRPIYQVHTASQFYDLVRFELGSANLKFDNETIRQFTKAIFQTMTKHMGEKEMRKVKALLRENVRDIIPVSLDKVVSAKSKTKTSRVTAH
ncbi:MAG: DUF2267 domain-containing protein [Pseudobdellovibrionaceae bacterium]